MKSVVLCLLDGWGCSDFSDGENAIRSASTPFLNYAVCKFPTRMLTTSGVTVGLPPNHMGSSEVGHTTIGSGRTIFQPLLRINNALESISSMDGFISFVHNMKEKTCHIVGLLSDGGVHSHENHIFRLIDELTKVDVNIVLHCILDGRDAPPTSGITHINRALKKLNSYSNVLIATICGRYYAMDRDKRMDRTEIAYDCIINAIGEKSDDPITTLKQKYSENITDEFIHPIVLNGYEGFKNDESLFIANFRADRVIQIASKFLKLNCNIAGMMKYSSSLDIPALFHSQNVANTLGEVLSNHKLKQLRVAETEKYAHATYFLNAKKEEPFPLEERILIPSPKVATYDLQPEMSAYETTEAAIPKIINNEFSFVFINYANADMVGHTGNFEATKKAISAVDECIGKIFAATQLAKDTLLIITADHGNAETMLDENPVQIHTSHTTNPVPFILCDESFSLRDGLLKDVAPTVLQLLGIEIPDEMEGTSLIISSKQE